MVDLEEGGRALGWIEGMDEDALNIGMPLKLEIKKLDDDRFTFVLRA